MLRAGEGVWLLVAATLCVGVIMVNSAGLSVGGGEQVTVLSIVGSRATLYAAAAVAIMLLASTRPANEALRWAVGQRWGRVHSLAIATGLLLLVCLLPYVPGIGREVNGAQRWVLIPGTSSLGFQPSELAKWAMPAVLAGYAVSRGFALRKFWTGMLPGLLAAGAIAAVIAVEDLGTAVLIAAVGCVILVAAGARVWQLAALAPAGLALVVGAIIAEPYRMRRLTAFLDPYADPEGSGYHMIQSMVAVANGEVFGRGLGFGLQKFGYLPEDRTDFLFAIICEELGLIGAGVVMTLYIALLWSCWSIVRRQADRGLRLFGLGVIATIGLQALINLFAVTGLGPTKGIALPLLSAGGTGWVATAAALGLIVGMERALQWRAEAEAFDDADATDAEIVVRDGLTPAGERYSPAA
ncbi:MAG: FtsW/RodA/SpoVE family cell cycle protein [Phycisphaerales bacterium]